MPINWQPGEKVIIPLPKTLEDLDKRIACPDLEIIDFSLLKIHRKILKC